MQSEESRLRLPLMAFGTVMVGALAIAQAKDGTVVPLTSSQAQDYMVTLVNRDRRLNGLSPVTLDLTASRAAQSHADEMVEFGYLSHWGLDGKKPVQRYTEGGGVDSDAENAEYSGGNYGDATSAPRRLQVTRQPTFLSTELDEFEASFMKEPDGKFNHRSNILDPQHTRVGIALSRASSDGSPGPDGLDRMSLTQEFIDGYGAYSPIPASLRPGQNLNVAGTLVPRWHFQSVDIRREALPHAMTISDLWKTYAYQSAPDTVIAQYSRNDGSSAVTVRDTAKGQSFSVPVALPQSWPTGLYYIEVWANNPTGGTLCVSRRTLVVSGQPQMATPSRLPDIGKPTTPPPTSVLWQPWKLVHAQADPPSHLHVRKGCSTVQRTHNEYEWRVEFTNDDAIASYKVVFQLVPPTVTSLPADWPQHALSVTVPPSKNSPPPASGRFLIAADCTQEPHLFDAIELVRAPVAQQ